MCGLVGVFSKAQNGFGYKCKDMFYTLMMIDALRGEDSTGAFLVHNSGDVTMAKEASVSGKFLQSKEYNDMMQAAWRDGSCIIGHNRKATKGTINDENAHPFIVDDKIVLVHNGTMWGDHKKHADVDVDSHAIAHLINDNERIEDALGHFYGAYALIWYNVEKEEVHLIRNKERPLWWAETDDAWIWSSEREMLLFSAARNQIKYKETPKLLPEETLQTFTLKDRKWLLSDRPIKINRNVASNNKSYVDLSGDDTPWSNFKDQMNAALEAAEAEDTPASKELFPLVHDSTVGGNSWEKTSDFERNMAKSCNKTVTLGEFNSEIINVYSWQEKVKCEAFEYIDDGNGGFYLYASPLDDPQVIFRHHFVKETKVDEARIMTMALNGYEMEFVVDKKSWSAINRDDKDKGVNIDGYCIVSSSGAKILSGGGITNDEKAKAF